MWTFSCRCSDKTLMVPNPHSHPHMPHTLSPIDNPKHKTYCNSYFIQLLESACSSVLPSFRHKKIPHQRYMLQGQGSWIQASFIPASHMHASGSRVIYIYASYMHASGSRVIYICIMDTCIYASRSRIKIIYISIIISVKDHRYMHRTYKHHTNIPQGQGSKIYASHTLASRITDICIIRISIRPIYIRVKDQRYVHHI